MSEKGKNREKNMRSEKNNNQTQVDAISDVSMHTTEMFAFDLSRVLLF